MTAETDWQPIESAPKDGRPLLLLSPEGYVGFGHITTEISEWREGEYIHEQACWLGRRSYETRQSFWMGGHRPSESVCWAPVPEPPAAQVGRHPEGGDALAAPVAEGD